MLKWILENKETLAWGAGAVIGVWRGLKYIRKKWYIPSKQFFEKLYYEINNNGGKSIKDMVENANETIIKIAAMNDALLSISEQCIYKCSPDGKCTFANDSLCELYGATQEEMLGYGWINFLDPLEREINQKNWERAVAHDSSITAEYTVIQGGTGERIQCYYKAAIKRNKDGEIISILGIVNRKNQKHII